MAAPRREGWRPNGGRGVRGGEGVAPTRPGGGFGSREGMRWEALAVASRRWDARPPLRRARKHTPLQVYMALRATRESCQMSVFLNVSAQKKANAAAAAASGISAAAAAAVAACQRSLQCETDTVTLWESAAGRTLSCTSFFASIAAAYPWTSACNQTRICASYGNPSGGGPGTTSTSAKGNTSVPAGKTSGAMRAPAAGAGLGVAGLVLRAALAFRAAAVAAR